MRFGNAQASLALLSPFISFGFAQLKVRLSNAQASLALRSALI